MIEQYRQIHTVYYISIKFSTFRLKMGAHPNIRFVTDTPKRNNVTQVGVYCWILELLVTRQMTAA